jgi:outer membrane protein insertion porin family/translocation and assembly module TamA
MDHDDSSKRRNGARAALLSVCAVMAVGCASPPPGRYPIDSVEIERVIVPGVDTEGTRRGVPASAIEEKIATAASPRFLGFFPRGVVLDYELFDRYVLDRDLTRIERIYRARGYYEAKVRAGRVERTDNGHVRVTVIVQEGSRIDVGDIRFEGVASLPIDDNAAIFAAVRRKLRKGRAFDEDNYQAAQENLVRALGDRGYAFAQVKGQAEVDLNRQMADVVLTVTPGPTARLGTITIGGLGDLPEEPVRRALDLSEGDLYSVSKLESARRAVLALGVFSDAEVVPELGNPASRTVPLNVHLARSELREVKLGGGIELDALRADMHLLTGWENRNFLGGLRRLTLDLRPGVVLFPTSTARFKPPEHYFLQGRARAELRQPGFIEARTGGIVRGEFAIYPVLFPGDPPAETQADGTPGEVPGYRDVSSGLGLDRTFGPLYASLFYNFQTSFPFAYVFQNAFPYASISDLSTPDPSSSFKKVVLSYVDLRTNLDFRDDAIRPHAGVFIGNDLQVAGVPVTPNFRSPGNDLFATDIRVQPEVRGYVPLTRRWTLAMRVSTGFLFPTDYGDSYLRGDPNSGDAQLVFFRGFFSGGPNSNRGYAFRGVGAKREIPFFLPGVSPGTRQSMVEAFCRDPLHPENANQLACKFPTGGLTLWETSVELRFPVAGELSGAIFCDASDVSLARVNIRLLYPHLSCGLGVHYNTPVGPLRLDAGFPIPGLQVLDPAASAAEKSSDSFYAISIGIGEAF